MTDESDVGSSTQPDADVNQNNNSDFNIPDEYKSEGWTNNLKSIDDLWKMNANAQKLIGRKNMPDANSSEADWQDFYAKMRPEKVEDYGIDFEDKAEKEFFEKAFFENGISKRQAEALLKEYKAVSDKESANMFTQTGYDEEMKQRFGEKVADVTNKVTALLQREANKDDLAALEAMPNNILGVVYSVMNKIMDRYAIKDSDAAAQPSGGGASGQPDVAGYTKALNDLTHRPHDMAEINALRTKFNIK